jgi:hypothetical protein
LENIPTKLPPPPALDTHERELAKSKGPRLKLQIPKVRRKTN